MTKVYLVFAQGCKATGALDLSTKRSVFAVFTNKKLAMKCADYMNNNWLLGHERNADFKAEQIKYYYVQIECISKMDYSKLPY